VATDCNFSAGGGLLAQSLLLMSTSLRLLMTAGLLSASILTAHARIERVVEKSFSVDGAGLLKVET
jgi:hypothetical protein